MPRWFEDDDSEAYLSARYPAFFDPNDYYSEVYPDYGPRIGPVPKPLSRRLPDTRYPDFPNKRQPTIGPAQRPGPKAATIGPAPAQVPWYERLGSYLGSPTGFERNEPPNLPMGKMPPVSPSIASRASGVASQAGRYLTQPTGFQRTQIPNRPMGQYQPMGQALGPTRQPIPTRQPVPGPAQIEPGAYGIYGDEFSSAVPNAFRIAMANARMNSNRPGVFSAQGVTDPRSVSVRSNVGGPPTSMEVPRRGLPPTKSDASRKPIPAGYPGATRVAAAARRPIGATAAPSVPVRPIPAPVATNGNGPYEESINDSYFNRQLASPFMGQEGPAQGGAWNRFNINDAPGRNAAAEGNFPGTVRGEPEPFTDRPVLPGLKYNWGPTEAYNKYLASEPGREDFRPQGWSRILNTAIAGLHGYRTGDAGEGISLGRQLNEEPYQEAIEGWKRRGAGLGRAVELEDKRYKIMVEDENRRTDNARQMAELDLRRKQYMLEDEKYRNLLGQQALKLKMEGWEDRIGPNGKVVMFRMGPEGPEYVETPMPNDEYTAAEKRAEALAVRDAAMARTRYSADTSAAVGREAIRARASEGEKARAHDTTENALNRAFGLKKVEATRNVTGGSDYTDPRTLLRSGDFRELDDSGLVRTIKKPGSDVPEIEFQYENEEQELEALKKAAGNDGAKFRRLAQRLAQFKEYMAQYGGG